MTLLFSNKNILHILCVAILIVFCFGAVNSVFAQQPSPQYTGGDADFDLYSRELINFEQRRLAAEANYEQTGDVQAYSRELIAIEQAENQETLNYQASQPSDAEAFDQNQTFENSGAPFLQEAHEVTPAAQQSNTGGGSGAYQTITPGGFPGSGASGGFGGILRTLFTWGVTLAALLAVTMLIVGGIEYMGSDSIFAKDQGRKRIASALGGLLIALTCVLLLGVILGFGGGGGSGGSFDVNLDF